MFGYVTRQEYEAERERRIRAEADAEAKGVQVAQLLKLVGDLVERQKAAPVPGFGVPVAGGPVIGPLTATEIWKIPAVGKRGVRERNAAARQAELLEEEEATDRKLADRRATLTPEEQQILDAQIPR